MLLLKVDDIYVAYGTHEVLHGINLVVQEKEMVAVFGHNGAGKSTLLKAIFGLIPVKTGHVFFETNDKTHWKPAVSTRSGIGFTLQVGNVFPNLKVLENLSLAGYGLHDESDVQRRINYVFELFPNLAERKNKAARLLSGGERQMLAVGLVLVMRPKLLLLDEPSFGLAPLVVKNLFKVIKDINAELGSSLVLVEQNVKEALLLVSRAYVMKEGNFVYEGLSENKEQVIGAIWGV